MSILQRHFLLGVTTAFISFLAFGIVYFLSFPLVEWSSLWKVKVFDLPFAVFALCICILLGLLVGLFSGLYWKKQIVTIHSHLLQLEQGRNIAWDNRNPVQEIGEIERELEKIQKQMKEQTKLSQKLANEKAVDIESRIQEIVSQERNRLARELHDSVSQQLFAASMLMSALTEPKEALEDRETKQLRMVEEMIHQSQLEMRALLLHLRPVALKGKTLQEGAEELLIELMQKVPMSIAWKIESFSIDKGVEDHLFRILQESLSNTLRHAKASSVEVLLISRDDFIILRVVDDGKGFDVEKERAGAYGLQNMYERAVEIGGTLKIVSVENQGTRLEVKVPKLDLKGGEND
ncbi:NarL family two-component system sensor histidine kinase LiaS [Bacillus tianshenii]|uniref:Sensor histidine kinase n=1 Tax=Sutcliffiella tianshenii TaxID=1463404 RepID=A0ABS2P6T0_9BACI|nr:sensor histidine kinase [Bacillus tianshenii]MBM7622418.1 NarL family two-component system sensor histidine kinase LiaS [Bacillus tianshenii]